MYGAALIEAVRIDSRNNYRIYRRHLRDVSNPFDVPDEQFRELYRLNKETANTLLRELEPHMKQGKRNTFIPCSIRMCAALHFFATGSCQRDIGQHFLISISRSVVNRSVIEVASIIERKLMKKWIVFPNIDEYDAIKQRFYEATGFPGTIGAVDCTHVRLKRPSDTVEKCYLNRKGYHSKNVQLICDYNLKILGGFARFGGAVHDSYIWEASAVNAMLEKRFESQPTHHSWILGDSGYSLKPWLITPYRSPSNESERKFNTVHAKGRNCIERLNRVLKSVFQCLSVGLQTTPQRAGQIINACTVLHNIRLAHGLIDYPQIEFDLEGDMNIEEEEHDRGELLRVAYGIRDQLRERICP